MKESQFGKDHWSTLLFLETQIVDKQFPIDLNRLRINSTKRPFRNSSPFGWKDDYSTILKNGEKEIGHDDIDVVNDFEDFGYLKNNGTNINIYPMLTERGYSVVSALRRHIANGGSTRNFRLEDYNFAINEVESVLADEDFEDDGAYAEDEL